MASELNTADVCTQAEVKRLKPLVRLEKDTVEALQIAMEEARAKHERKVDKLKAGIQQLEDENDGLDGLIHEMRPQIKELSHDKGLLQVQPLTHVCHLLPSAPASFPSLACWRALCVGTPNMG